MAPLDLLDCSLGAPSWRRKWQPTPVVLPGKSNEQRNLVSHSPWGLAELDMAERTHLGHPGSERHGAISAPGTKPHLYPH